MKRLRAVTTMRREKRLKASKKQKRKRKDQRQGLKQLELFRPRRSPAAAREHLPTRRGRVPHSTRPEVSGGVHVVQRIARGLPELRTPRLLRVFERCFRAAKEKEGFALTHYSVQRDHLHLVVEAKDRHSLARGMQALSIRVAKQLNSHWHRRGKGRVFAERYFATALTSWQQIWRTIRYVLSNGRKHGTWTEKDRPDPFSSGPWFTQWWNRPRRPTRSSPVMPSRWVILLRRFDVNEIPCPRWHEAIA